MVYSPNHIEDIELQTHLENCALRMSQIQRFDNASGYTCILEIRSGGFSCTRRFFFDDAHLTKAIESLHAMNSGEPGKAIIKGMWDEDFVMLTVDRLGHVEVIGELFEHSGLPQMLKFGFATDQTVLGPLLRGLEAIRGA